MGLESVSDVDIDIDIDEPSDASESPGTGSGSGRSGKRQSEDVETEEDPTDPLTPGPGVGAFATVDDEDAEWLDPSLPTPTPQAGKGKMARMQRMGAPIVREHAAAQQEYYPFPVVDDREDDDPQETPVLQPQAQVAPRQRASMSYTREKSEGGGSVGGASSRSRPTRARDGGRTQSGGVRGIVPPDGDDGDDF